MQKPIVLFVINLILFVLINGLFIFFILSFNKKTKNNIFHKTYINKKLFVLILWPLELSLVPTLLGLIGTQIGWSNAVIIPMMVIGVVCIFIPCGLAFFFLQYLAIGISDQDVEFLGEKINLAKVYNLSQNDKKYFINYYEGRRAQKKYSFCLKSKAYAFIKENEELIKSKTEIEQKEIPASDAE